MKEILACYQALKPYDIYYHMKFLNLVLYSNSSVEHQEGYEEMQKTLEKYYKSFPDVYTIFYKYSEDIDTDVFMDNQILHFKGKESLVPGVLEKTLKVFEYVIDNEIMNKYDYVIRSNISSIVNFDLLAKELQSNPMSFYGGPEIQNLQWNGGGITDSTWYGTLFACGTCLIFTKEAIQYIVSSQHLLHKNIVDDIAIAILFREHRPDIQAQQFKDRSQYKPTPVFYTERGFDIGAIRQYIKSNNIIVYRNRCYNCRKVDEIQMQLIVDILLNNI